METELEKQKEKLWEEDINRIILADNWTPWSESDRF